jgi:hypothetical protein
MKKCINSCHIEGYVYEHKLESKVSGENSKNPGTEFIAGTLSIATDDDLLNVVPVHFTYVTETTGKGKPNATYTLLQNIIDGKVGSVMANGKENAGKVRIDTALGLNEFYSDRNGKTELVSVKRNEGGFVHATSELAPLDQRAVFDTDMLINGVARLEPDEDRELPERMAVKGCVFDFRGALLPVEFTVYNPKAMDYFESLEPSQKNIIFTHVRGQQVSKTVIRKIEEESAFGEASVREVRNTQRDFVITWAQPEPYVWDDESTILATELDQKISEREIYLADVKRRQDEYQATKNSAFGTSKAAAPAKGEYKF